MAKELDKTFEDNLSGKFTGDPDIKWDGTDMTTHQSCSDGVYFYLCDVYENSLCGVVKRTLKGTVTILR